MESERGFFDGFPGVTYDFGIKYGYVFISDLGLSAQGDRYAVAHGYTGPKYVHISSLYDECVNVFVQHNQADSLMVDVEYTRDGYNYFEIRRFYQDPSSEREMTVGCAVDNMGGIEPFVRTIPEHIDIDIPSQSYVREVKDKRALNGRQISTSDGRPLLTVVQKGRVAVPGSICIGVVPDKLYDLNVHMAHDDALDAMKLLRNIRGNPSEDLVMALLTHLNYINQYLGKTPHGAWHVGPVTQHSPLTEK